MKNYEKISILKKTIKEIKNNKKIIVNLAINYGSKHEILYAAKQSARKISIMILSLV